MRVKFNFSSHDSPEVLRLAASFLTTLSDLTAEEYAPIPTETLRQMTDAAPVAAPQEDAPAKKKRAAAKAVEETSTDLGQSPSAPIVGGSDTADTSSAPTVDLTKVRALLAEKSRSGKRTEVQTLIAEYGVSTLTDIPADKLAEIYSKGNAI